MPRSAASQRFAMRPWGDKSLLFSAANVDFGTTSFAFDRLNAFSGLFCVFWLGSMSNNRTIFGRVNTGANSRGWRIYLTTNGRLQFDLVDDESSAKRIRVRSNDVFSPNKWNWIGFSYDGSAQASGVKLFLEGQQITDTDVSNGISGGGSIVDAGINARMGTRTDGTQNFDGYQAFMDIHASVLNPGDFQDMIYSGKIPASAYATCLFTEGTGSTLGDSSGNARNGTINSATWNTAYAPLQLARTASSARSVASERTAVV